MSIVVRHSRRVRFLSLAGLFAVVLAMMSSGAVVPAMAALDHDTVTADMDYFRYTNMPEAGLDHLTVSAASLPSGEEPSGTFSVSCDTAETGCYPYTGTVDCVNVQGAEAVVSGPIEGPDYPANTTRVTLVLFDRTGDGLVDGFHHGGFGSAADGTPGSPDCTMYSLYQPYYMAESGGITTYDAPGTTTPVGTNVSVAPPDQSGATDVRFTYDSVTDAGVTTVATSTTGPTPSGFNLATDPPVYYQLETTASFTGQVEVCVRFDTSGMTEEQTYSQHLYHYTNGAWEDITSSQADGQVCGLTSSFSPFAVGQPKATAWPFRGFLQPVDDEPTINKMKAGLAVPVKFSLGGARGLDILASGSPASETVPCTKTTGVDAVERTVTAGTSSLGYNTKTDIYTYTWKTAKAWAGTCRQFQLKLTDGTTHTATFKFTK